MSTPAQPSRQHASTDADAPDEPAVTDVGEPDSGSTGTGTGAAGSGTGTTNVGAADADTAGRGTQSSGSSVVAPRTRREAAMLRKRRNTASPATRWRDRIIVVVIIWALWALISTFIVQPFKIPSGSMESTLEVGDHVVVKKWVSGDDVKRGEIIVFKDPDHWLPDEQPGNPILRGIRTVAEATHLSASGNHLVKRVIGLPGDRVSCTGLNGKVTVNGVAIDEPYVRDGVRPCDSYYGQYTFSVTVPKDRLWVMGDNRNNSEDSRYHYQASNGHIGFVPLDDVTGTSIAVVWPATRWSGGHNDEEAFAKVPDPQG